MVASSQHNNYLDESGNVNYESGVDKLVTKKADKLILNNDFILFKVVYVKFKYYI